MELDSGRRRHRLPLVDEVVDEVPEIGRQLLRGEVWVVREAGERGDRVHRGVEDQLGPLRRPQVGQCLHLEPRRPDQRCGLLHALVGGVLVRPEPCLGVEDVLDVRVVVPRAAHERDRGDDRPGPVPPHGLLGAEAVEGGHDRRLREVALERRRRVVEAGRLRGHDAEVERRDPTRVARSGDGGSNLAAAADPQAVRVQRVCMLLPPGEDADLGDLRQMACKQASDHTAADDADTLDHRARRL